MDENSIRRRQNEPAVHSSSAQRYPQQPQQQQPPPPIQDPAHQRRYATSSTTDSRYRTSAPLNTSPAGATRGLGGSSAYGGYYQDSTGGAFQTAAAMPQSSLSSYNQSAGDYGQDGRQAPGFANYNPAANMMYNVQSASSQNPSVYDTNQQSFQRQPASALQMIATDVGTASSYFSSDTASTATASLQPQPASSSTSSGVYQNPADRSALLGYSSNMTAMGGLAGQSTASASAPVPAATDVGMEDAEYPVSSGLDEAYASYQSALKEIFQNVRNGVLQSASESLLNVSDWLLSHVTELGLTSDDQSLHRDRIKLWNDFNHAWLALLQKQKDMVGSGQQLQRSQSIVTQEGLENMGKELLRLCDQIERHGLVDYQYGVWEEQIIAKCTDLYSPDTEEPCGLTTGSSSSRQK